MADASSQKKRDKADKEKKHKKSKSKGKDRDDSSDDDTPDLPTPSTRSSSKAPDLRAPASLPAPSSSPTSLSSSTPSSTGARLVHACLVELYEMIKGKAKGYGAKGLALIRTIDNAYTLLLYQPSTTRHEFQVGLTPELELHVLPDRWATFVDRESRHWSVKFSTAEDQWNFGRAFACCKDDLGAFEHTRGGTRRLIQQDLAVGTGDVTVDAGDSVKVKYSVYLTSPTHPIGIGDKVATKDSKQRFQVGSGAMSLGIEQGLIGMKKKGVRFLVIPPMMSDFDVTEFGPHIPVNSTLLVEVQLTSLHTDRVADTVELSAPDLDAVKGDGDAEDDPPPPSASTLKDRMKNLSIAAAPALSILTQPVQSAHTHASPHASHTTQPSHQHPAPQPSPGHPPPHLHPSHLHLHAHGGGHPDPELEHFLQSLAMSEFLPNFQREGIRFVDLRLLDDMEEMKVLVPQLGPRKRLLKRLDEMKDETTPDKADHKPGPPTATHKEREREDKERREDREREDRDREREKERETRERDLRERESREARDREVLREREAREREKERERDREREREQRERERRDVAPRDNHLSGHHTAASPHPHPHSHSFDASASSSTSRSVSNLRSRFDLSPALGPEADLHPSHTQSTPLPPSSDYHRGLSEGKEQGKEEVTRLARERIDAMKTEANVRFHELQRELEDVKRGREDDVRRAKEVIQSLRAELKLAVEEKEGLIEKMKAYVEKVRVKGEEEGKEAGVVMLRGAMDGVYRAMTEMVGPKELYEGGQVLDMMKKTLKQVTQHTMHQQQHHHHTAADK